MKRKNYTINPIFVERLNFIFAIIEKCGWKKWGSFTKKDGSSYQCFRKGNRYVWAGYTYLQTDNNDVIQYAKFTDLDKNEYMHIQEIKDLLSAYNDIYLKIPH
jgi:hypothetical protein